MPITLVGRESYFHGKSLFEIARNLKNFGVGRYVVRKQFERYQSPSFYKLTAVVPEMNAKGYNKGTAYGEKVFRGQNYGVCKIDAGGKYDWVLIPKDQEQALIDSVKDSVPPESKVIPSLIQIPPLMEIICRDEALADGHDVTDGPFYWKQTIEQSKMNHAKLEECDFTPPIKFAEKST